MCEVATVGKLECAHATLVECLYYILCYLYIIAVEYRYHTGSGNLGKYLLFVEFCHNNEYN